MLVGADQSKPSDVNSSASQHVREVGRGSVEYRTSRSATLTGPLNESLTTKVETTIYPFVVTDESVGNEPLAAKFASLRVHESLLLTSSVLLTVLQTPKRQYVDKRTIIT